MKLFKSRSTTGGWTPEDGAATEHVFLGVRRVRSAAEAHAAEDPAAEAGRGTGCRRRSGVGWCRKSGSAKQGLGCGNRGVRSYTLAENGGSLPEGRRCAERRRSRCWGFRGFGKRLPEHTSGSAALSGLPEQTLSK